MTASLAHGLRKLGVRVVHDRFFDTLRVEGEPAKVDGWLAGARARRINLRRLDDRSLGVALDETTSRRRGRRAARRLRRRPAPGVQLRGPRGARRRPALGGLERASAYLTHPVFNTHHSETEMLRYMRTLEERDLSLVHSMIPLGSCTMKLNATAEMMPITWARFNRIHPFAPARAGAGLPGRSSSSSRRCSPRSRASRR